MLRKVSLQSRIPFQLVFMPGRTDLIPIGHVCIDDGDAPYSDTHQARVVNLWQLIVESVEDAVGFCPSQYGHAVVRLHPAVVNLVSGRLKHKSWEQFVLD